MSDNDILVISSPSDRFVVPLDCITGYSSYPEEATDSFSVTITLNTDMTNWYARETAEHIGETISISFCGTIMSQGIVQEQVTTGRLVLPDQFDGRAGAHAFIDQIVQRQPCP